MTPRPKSLAAHAVAPQLHPSAPHGHGGASSLLRMGLQASPRPAPATRLFTERPFLLQQRAPSRQMNLFGPGTPR